MLASLSYQNVTLYTDNYEPIVDIKNNKPGLYISFLFNNSGSKFIIETKSREYYSETKCSILQCFDSSTFKKLFQITLSNFGRSFFPIFQDETSDLPYFKRKIYFSADDTKIIVDNTFSIKIFCVFSHELIHTYNIKQLNNCYNIYICFDYFNRMIVSQNRTIKFFDLETFKLIKKIRLPNYISAMFINGDRNYLVIIHKCKSVKVFNVDTLKCINSFNLNCNIRRLIESNTLRKSVCVSGNKLFLSMEYQIYIFDILKKDKFFEMKIINDGEIETACTNTILSIFGDDTKIIVFNNRKSEQHELDIETSQVLKSKIKIPYTRLYAQPKPFDMEKYILK